MPTNYLRRPPAALLLLIALLSMLPAGAARAAHGVPLSLFDPPSVGWYSIRNMTVDDHQAFFNSTAAAGYMMIDAERLEISGKLRVSSVWQRNTDGRGWVSRSNLTSDEFHSYWEQYLKEGYRLIDQDAYPIDGALRYAGIWVQNVEKLGWASYRNLTSEQFGDHFDDFSKRGFILVDTEAYGTADGLRYSQIWVQNTAGLGWIALRNMSSEQYAAAFDEQAKKGFRVLDLESYQDGAAQRYAAIWVQNTSGRGWYAYRDMSAQQYGNRWLELRDAGYRLIDFEVYNTGAGVRYAGVWRQNSSRPSWRLKDDVSRIIEGYLAENDIAGLGVAISVGGQFRYLRGFGHADIASDRVFHSGTVARAASGCKAVAGVLALRLEETTAFDIDSATRAHAPSLPAHHTHTVAQLLANRGGVRHYFAGADPTKGVDEQYDTALAAAELFEDDPLSFAPGAGYGYSTHGYTLAAAAMEGFTGDPIGAILDERLSQPFGLPTLQIEDRSVPNPQRATLYRGGDSGPEPIAPDNISWKSLGGGCEVSAQDFARMGLRLADGSLLSQASLDRMWDAPDNLSNYALGWNTGTADGDLVVAKGGSQAGGRSYLRIYPEQEIVVALISNQRGHPIEDLGREIGALILDNLGAALLAEGAGPAQGEAADLSADATAPAQADAGEPEPTAELGDPALGVPLPALLPPTATDDTSEPAEPAFPEGAQTFQLFLPLLRQ